MAEHGEAPGAVDARRLALILGHVLERGEVDEDVEADSRPGVDRGEQEERLVGIVEELLAAEPHPRDGVVDDPVLRVEHVQEDHAGRGRRGHERHEEARAVEADEADLLVQQHGQAEAEQHRQRHVQQRELERAADGVEPLLVVRERAVVREADAVLGPEAAARLGREQERPDDREEPEPEHEHRSRAGRTTSRSGSRAVPAATPAGAGARVRPPPRSAQGFVGGLGRLRERVLRAPAPEQRRRDRLADGDRELRVALTGGRMWCAFARFFTNSAAPGYLARYCLKPGNAAVFALSGRLLEPMSQARSWAGWWSHERNVTAALRRSSEWLKTM